VPAGTRLAGHVGAGWEKPRIWKISDQDRTGSRGDLIDGGEHPAPVRPGPGTAAVTGSCGLTGGVHGMMMRIQPVTATLQLPARPYI
jgi:hypothetical protein